MSNLFQIHGIRRLDRKVKRLFHSDNILLFAIFLLIGLIHVALGTRACSCTARWCRDWWVSAPDEAAARWTSATATPSITSSRIFRS